MRTKTLIFLGISICVLIVSCEDSVMKRREYVRVENNSSVRIYATEGIGEENGGLNVYPDTSLTSSEPYFREVPIGETEILLSTPSISAHFEQVLNGSLMSIYIFNADSVDILGWEEIRNQNMVLKRFDLSKEEIELLGHTVTYP